jgi:hypothetical protein
MQTQHTPGPWILTQGEDVYVSLAPDNVIRCMDERSSVATGQDYANARLIAAAPELLEALRKAVETTYSDTLFLEWNALIAKATGEQP